MENVVIEKGFVFVAFFGLDGFGDKNEEYFFFDTKEEAIKAAEEFPVLCYKSIYHGEKSYNKKGYPNTNISVLEPCRNTYGTPVVIK